MRTVAARTSPSVRSRRRPGRPARQVEHRLDVRPGRRRPQRGWHRLGHQSASRRPSGERAAPAASRLAPSGASSKRPDHATFVCRVSSASSATSERGRRVPAARGRSSPARARARGSLPDAGRCARRMPGPRSSGPAAGEGAAPGRTPRPRRARRPATAGRTGRVRCRIPATPVVPLPLSSRSSTVSALSSRVCAVAIRPASDLALDLDQRCAPVPPEPLLARCLRPRRRPGAARGGGREDRAAPPAAGRRRRRRPSPAGCRGRRAPLPTRPGAFAADARAPRAGTPSPGPPTPRRARSDRTRSSSWSAIVAATRSRTFATAGGRRVAPMPLSSDAGDPEGWLGDLRPRRGGPRAHATRGSASPGPLAR